MLSLATNTFYLVNEVDCLLDVCVYRAEVRTDAFADLKVTHVRPANGPGHADILQAAQICA